MRWLMIVAGTVVAVVAAAFVVGTVRPAKHVASTRSELATSPAEVWAAITDWEHWGEWQPEITGVERLPDRDGRPALITKGSWGDLPMEIAESDEPHRFVTVVDGGAFTGRWTYEMEPSGSGTRLTITEEGEIANPLFRTMMLFHDNYETMLGYHHALAARLGVAVEPVRVNE